MAKARQRTVYPVEPVPQPDVKPEPWKPLASPEHPSNPASQENGIPIERAPDGAAGELMIPRDESEPQKPAHVRSASKLELKPQQAAGAKKAEAKQETLQFEPISRGRFEKSEPTIIDGQDLDVPTFLRKNLKIR